MAFIDLPGWEWLRTKWRLGQRVHTPTLLQMEMVECGAAALGIILAYYGRIVPLAELRRECGVSRDGSKASNLIKAARRYGAEGQGFKVKLESQEELKQIAAVELPFIVFWEFNHFLVVEGFSHSRVFLNDPATGPRSVTWSEFDHGFTGVVLQIRPGPDFERKGRKPSTWGGLWRRLRGSSGALAYCLVAGFLLTLVGLVVPVFTQVLVDQVLIQERQDWLRPLLLGMGVAALLQGILSQLQLRYLRRLNIKLAVSLSSQFLWHLLRLPAPFYAQRFAGEIGYRLQLNNKVAQALSGQLATTVISAVTALCYGLVLVQYDVLLTAIGVGFALINLLALRWISRFRVDKNARLIQEQGKQTGIAIAGLQGIESLKAGGLESDFFSRWSGYYAKTLNTQQQLVLSNRGISVLPVFLSSLVTLLILIVGGWRVMNGVLSIGMLVAFQGIMSQFLQPIGTLVNFGSLLQELEGDLNRLDDVLQNPPISHPDTYPEFQDGVKLRGSVEMQEVTFGYSPVDPPVIQDFNLSVQPGQRIALVGRSGSGKSSLARLIAGLYEPWAGEICFDGIPRSQWSRTVLTHSLAMVEQDILLFKGTVRDNLTLWDDTIPQTDLVRACRDAEIHEDIVSLKGGYEGELAEGGANLSGGQRQRLEIARALVNNPSILILDEATSALDAETEYQIALNLRQRQCTMILVAHRLSTIRDCDQILVLQAGQVVEQGTHDQLWALQGVYAQLIRSEGEAI